LSLNKKSEESIIFMEDVNN